MKVVIDPTTELERRLGAVLVEMSKVVLGVNYEKDGWLFWARLDPANAKNGEGWRETRCAEAEQAYQKARAEKRAREILKAKAETDA